MKVTEINLNNNPSFKEVARQLRRSKNVDILFTGDKPTQYKYLYDVIMESHRHHKHPFLVTDGTDVNEKYALLYLSGLIGITFVIPYNLLNISNRVTNSNLNEERLKKTISVLKNRYKVKIRFQCDVAEGYIDTEKKIYKYIHWAKDMKVDAICFSEKEVKGKILKLKDIFGERFDLDEETKMNKASLMFDLPIQFNKMKGIEK